MPKRPDLNGLCIRKPGHAEIYLILNGERRHIPDPRTFNLLFRPDTPVYLDFDIDHIDDGGPLVNGACLVRADGQAEVDLLPGGEQRMGVPSPQVMDEYSFDWAKVVSIPVVAFNAIPKGPNIAGRASSASLAVA